jgi:hypothetical protein
VHRNHKENLARTLLGPSGHRADAKNNLTAKQSDCQAQRLPQSNAEPLFSWLENDSRKL